MDIRCRLGWHPYVKVPQRTYRVGIAGYVYLNAECPRCGKSIWLSWPSS